MYGFWKTCSVFIYCTLYGACKGSQCYIRPVSIATGFVLLIFSTPQKVLSLFAMELDWSPVSTYLDILLKQIFLEIFQKLDSVDSARYTRKKQKRIKKYLYIKISRYSTCQQVLKETVDEPHYKECLFNLCEKEATK